MLIFFSMSTKQKFKIGILFKIFAVVTTLKTSFLNNLTFFFCLYIVYWADFVLKILLLNISNLSINLMELEY